MKYIYKNSLHLSQFWLCIKQAIDLNMHSVMVTEKHCLMHFNFSSLALNFIHFHDKIGSSNSLFLIHLSEMSLNSI